MGIRGGFGWETTTQVARNKGGCRRSQSWDGRAKGSGSDPAVRRDRRYAGGGPPAPLSRRSCSRARGSCGAAVWALRAPMPGPCLDEHRAPRPTRSAKRRSARAARSSAAYRLRCWRDRCPRACALTYWVEMGVRRRDHRTKKRPIDRVTQTKTVFAPGCDENVEVWERDGWDLWETRTRVARNRGECRRSRAGRVQSEDEGRTWESAEIADGPCLVRSMQTTVGSHCDGLVDCEADRGSTP